MHFVSASLGAGAPGAYLTPNTNLAASGMLGFLVGYMPPGTFAAGTQQLVNLRFASLSYSNTTGLVFGDTPISRELDDSAPSVLAANYQNATLVVGGAAWPQLSISLDASGTNIVLSWPSSAAAFNLVTAPSLGTGWSGVASSLTTNASSISTTLPISNDPAFYRLQLGGK
jgi:hypothetical protein